MSEVVKFMLANRNRFTANLGDTISVITNRRPGFRMIPFTNSRTIAFNSSLQAYVTGVHRTYSNMLIFISLLNNAPFGRTVPVAARLSGIAIIAKAGLPVLIRLIVAHTFKSPALSRLTRHTQIINHRKISLGGLRVTSISRSSRV